MGKNRISVAEYLGQQIAMSGKTQLEISTEVGYPNSNFITMMKKGTSKLPVNKVPQFAKALGVDKLNLLRLVMNEYMPDTWEVVNEIVGDQMVTEGEHDILAIIRDNSDGYDVAPQNDDERAELAALVSKWRERAKGAGEAAVRRVEAAKKAK